MSMAAIHMDTTMAAWLSPATAAWVGRERRGGAAAGFVGWGGVGCVEVGQPRPSRHTAHTYVVWSARVAPTLPARTSEK